MSSPCLGPIGKRKIGVLVWEARPLKLLSGAYAVYVCVEVITPTGKLIQAGYTFTPTEMKNGEWRQNLQYVIPPLTYDIKRYLEQHQ